jgi:hypothetical protein
MIYRFPYINSIQTDEEERWEKNGGSQPLSKQQLKNPSVQE